MALFDDTRSDWNARPALRGGFPYVAPSRRTGRMWHWNGPPVHLIGKPHSACLAAVLGDQRYHQSTNGWRDIGYQALVCPHGRAIEGAGADKIAAHCKGYNTSHYGIQLMIGEGESAPSAMYARAVRLAADLQARSGHTLDDLGHRQGFATSCPGDEVYAWVRAGGPRGSLAGSGGGTTSPTTGGASGGVIKEDDMPTPKDLTSADIIPAPDKSTTNPTWSMDTYFPATYRNARASFQNTEEIKSDLAGLTATLDTILELLKSASTGADLPTRDEILAQVRAAADERMKTLTFNDGSPS